MDFSGVEQTITGFVVPKRTNIQDLKKSLIYVLNDYYYTIEND